MQDLGIMRLELELIQQSIIFRSYNLVLAIIWVDIL